MAIDLKSATPDTSFGSGAYLFGADSQSSSTPSIYSVDDVFGYLLGLANSWTGQQTFASGTITTSKPTQFTQTWNEGSTTFTGLLANITDTASSSSSLLMDLQVGGSSKFSVDKNGALTNHSIFTGGILGSSGSTGGYSLSYYGNGFWLGSACSIGWSPGIPSLGTDLILRRRTAANLQLGATDAASPIAQTLSVQSVIAGTTNGAGQNFTITGSQGTGSGAGGSIIFQVAPAGSSGTSQNALATALTINSARNIIVAGSIFNTDGISGIQPNTSSIFYIDVPGNFVMRNNGGGYAQLMGVTAGGLLSLGPSGGAVFLTPDTANTLALRNGTNAQAFRVYNTYTDSSNYERAKIAWDSNVLKIGTEKAGTGTARALELQTDGTTRFTISETSSTLTAAGSGASILLGSGGNLRTRYISTSGNILNMFDFVNDGTGTATYAVGGSSPLLRFGGTTSSFPALKRSSTTLQARLADDSAFAPVQGKLTTDTAYTAGAPTATGYIVLYDSTGTAYKVPAEAL